MHKPLRLTPNGKWLTRHEFHFAKQGGLCHYCGRKMVLAAKGPENRNNTYGGLRCTVDHMTPRERGGSNDLSNQVGACDDCNQRKGMMTAEEFTLRIDANAILWLRDSTTQSCREIDQTAITTASIAPIITPWSSGDSLLITDANFALSQ